jgi:hypothetical protein
MMRDITPRAEPRRGRHAIATMGLKLGQGGVAHMSLISWSSRRKEREGSQRGGSAGRYVTSTPA